MKYSLATSDSIIELERKLKKFDDSIIPRKVVNSDNSFVIHKGTGDYRLRFSISLLFQGKIYEQNGTTIVEYRIKPGWISIEVYLVVLVGLVMGLRWSITNQSLANLGFFVMGLTIIAIHVIILGCYIYKYKRQFIKIVTGTLLYAKKRVKVHYSFISAV